MTTLTRVFAALLSAATFVALGAASAMADEPNSAAWPDGAGRSVLDTLLLFVGGTVVLFVAISLFGLLTARRNFVPAPPSTDLEKAPSSSAAHR